MEDFTTDLSPLNVKVKSKVVKPSQHTSQGKADIPPLPERPIKPSPDSARRQRFVKYPTASTCVQLVTGATSTCRDWSCNTVFDRTDSGRRCSPHLRKRTGKRGGDNNNSVPYLTQ